MAHSYIISGTKEFEVRDSNCEIILEKLKRQKWSSTDLTERIAGWYEYWFEMPPGCKELDMEVSNIEERKELHKMLINVILPDTDKESELANTVQKIITLFDES